jgi:hypothetical protein
MSWGVLVTHDLLMVAVGLSFEVVFTALTEREDARLLGYTYLWMIPIYALLYPGFCLLSPYLFSWPWVARGLFYVAAIYLVEYISGRLIRSLTGKCPWEESYYKSRWGVHGLIRLDFAPAWFGGSLLYEYVFRVLRGLA